MDAQEHYPIQLSARLDEHLSRWMWLVKWVLVLPHLIVLGFQWIAFSVLTVVAGVSILFTGRYPRAIFDFNVAVMDWSWRVTHYAFVLGTDRYPHFGLQPDPTYPARLTVTYPEGLSRPLVLVKWLLGLPHFIVAALFVGGMQAGSTGVVAVLVLVAAVMLTFTGRYPGELFGLIVGMERWAYRALAYGALMTDVYPPFRLDQGGEDPGAAQPALPVEPAAPSAAAPADTDAERPAVTS